jgi:hypothetical protein
MFGLPILSDQASRMHCWEQVKSGVVSVNTAAWGNLTCILSGLLVHNNAYVHLRRIYRKICFEVYDKDILVPHPNIHRTVVQRGTEP